MVSGYARLLPRRGLRGDVHAAQGPARSEALPTERARRDRTRARDQRPRGDLEGARVLEIGGGIGALTAELLAAGASRGEIVELVATYAPYARQLAEEHAIANRSVFRVADVLAEPAGISAATVVVLNRVVCCSPDGVALTGAAARLAERWLLLSFPRDRWFIRMLVGAVNVGQRLLGRSFRVFLHPPAALRAAARAEGLHAAAAGRDAAWEFVVFRRAT
jgi:magnesium-protoporphyrin O-methyltransferase